MGGYFWDGVLWNLMMDGLWKDGWAMERWMDSLFSRSVMTELHD
jgi:hypothetical protein